MFVYTSITREMAFMYSIIRVIKHLIYNGFYTHNDFLGLPLGMWPNVYSNIIMWHMIAYVCVFLWVYMYIILV